MYIIYVCVLCFMCVCVCFVNIFCSEFLSPSPSPPVHITSSTFVVSLHLNRMCICVGEVQQLPTEIHSTNNVESTHFHINYTQQYSIFPIHCFKTIGIIGCLAAFPTDLLMHTYIIFFHDVWCFTCCFLVLGQQVE